MSSVSPKNFHHKNLSSSHLQMVTPWNICSFTRRVIPPEAGLALACFLLYKEKLVYPSKFTCSSAGNQVSTNVIKSNYDISFLKLISSSLLRKPSIRLFSSRNRAWMERKLLRKNFRNVWIYLARLSCLFGNFWKCWSIHYRKLSEIQTGSSGCVGSQRHCPEQRRFWATHANQKWTVCTHEQVH